MSTHGILARVGHGQQSLLGVLQLEVLVGELVAVNAFSASTIALRKVTTLNHEVLDNAVEGRALVAKALLAGSQSSEVLGGLCWVTELAIWYSMAKSDSVYTFGTVLPYNPMVIRPRASSPCWMSK